MKNIVFFIFPIVLFSCSKDCRECFMDETNAGSGTITTTSLGSRCGNELKNTDSTSYEGNNGAVFVYCP